MKDKKDTGKCIVKWFLSKIWLHRGVRKEKPAKVVRCRTMEELEKEFKSWNDDK